MISTLVFQLHVPSDKMIPGKSNLPDRFSDFIQSILEICMCRPIVLKKLEILVIRVGSNFGFRARFGIWAKIDSILFIMEGMAGEFVLVGGWKIEIIFLSTWVLLEVLLGAGSGAGSWQGYLTVWKLVGHVCEFLEIWGGGGFCSEYVVAVCRGCFVVEDSGVASASRIVILWFLLWHVAVSSAMFLVCFEYFVLMISIVHVVIPIIDRYPSITRYCHIIARPLFHNIV